MGLSLTMPIYTNFQFVPVPKAKTLFLRPDDDSPDEVEYTRSGSMWMGQVVVGWSLCVSLTVESIRGVHKPRTMSDRIIRRQFTDEIQLRIVCCGRIRPPTTSLPLLPGWQYGPRRGRSVRVVKWGIILLCSVNRKRLTFAEHLCDTRSTI